MMNLVVIEVDTGDDLTAGEIVTRIYTDDPTLKDRIAFVVKSYYLNEAVPLDAEVEYDPDFVKHLVKDGGPY